MNRFPVSRHLILVFFGIISACSKGGSGSGDPGPGPLQIQNTCAYSMPDPTLGGVSGTDFNSVRFNIHNLVKTPDNRLGFVYEQGFHGYRYKIWDGVSWIEKVGSPTGLYNSISGETSFFSLGNSFAFREMGSGVSYPYANRLSIESSPDFNAGMIMNGIGTSTYWRQGNGAFAGKLSLSGIRFSPNALVFADNSTSGDFGNYLEQVVDTSATASFQSGGSGFFADGSAFIIGLRSESGASTLSIYRKVGISWSKLVDIATNTNLGSQPPSLVFNKGGTMASIVWAEYQAANGGNPQQSIIKAASINLSNRTVSAPATITTILNPVYSNGVKVSHDYFSEGTSGVILVHAFGKGAISLAKFDNGIFGSAEEYRPDLAFSNQNGASIKIAGCDKVVLVASTNSTSELHIQELKSSNYDGVAGN